jgi:hypothetical protein
MALVAVVAPMLATAQGISGSHGGDLSERAYYAAFYRGHPDSAVMELIVVLRGAPGWRARGHGYESIGPLGNEALPIRHSLAIGSRAFEYSYRASDRTLRIGNAEYPLGSHNVVVLDSIDSMGGPLEIVRLTLTLPSNVSRHSLSEALRQIPPLHEYIR